MWRCQRAAGRNARFYGSPSEAPMTVLKLTQVANTRLQIPGVAAWHANPQVALTAMGGQKCSTPVQPAESR